MPGAEPTQVTYRLLGISLASPSGLWQAYPTIAVDTGHAPATVIGLAVAFVVNGAQVMLTGTTDGSFHTQYL